MIKGKNLIALPFVYLFSDNLIGTIIDKKVVITNTIAIPVLDLSSTQYSCCFVESHSSPNNDDKHINNISKCFIWFPC